MKKNEKLAYRINTFMGIKHIGKAAEVLGIKEISLRQYFDYNGFNYKEHTSAGKYTYTIENIESNAELYYYFLGLVCADGSIKKHDEDKRNQVTIELKNNDLHILEYIRDEICPGKPIPQTRPGYNYLTLNHSFFDSYFKKHNVKSNKTVDLDPTNICKNNMNHFIRGYFDGDGSISYQNKERGYKQVSILGTSQVTKLISDHLLSVGIECKTYNIPDKNNGNFFCIRIASQDEVVKFREFIYDGSTIHLNRKYDKFYE